MTDFIASNGFPVKVTDDGGLLIDNLVIGPQAVKAFAEYTRGQLPRADYQVHIPAWQFEVNLDELDSQEAVFSWNNFEPSESDLTVGIPVGIWKEMGRPGVLTLDIHEEV